MLISVNSERNRDGNTLDLLLENGWILNIWRLAPVCASSHMWSESAGFAFEIGWEIVTGLDTRVY